MGPAFATKLTRHRAFKIGTREFARFAAGVTKVLWRRVERRQAGHIDKLTGDHHGMDALKVWAPPVTFEISRDRLDAERCAFHGYLQRVGVAGLSDTRCRQACRS